MKNLALKRVQEMRAYKAPRAGRAEYDGLLLDLNERTTPLQPEVVEAVRRYADSGRMQVYPEYPELMRRLAEYAGVGEEQIMITNGSDRALEIAFRTFTDAGHKVVIPQPSFSMLFQNARLMGNEIISPQYSADSLEYPLEEVLGMAGDGVKMITVCNPNNPTGTAISADAVASLARSSEDTLVLVDEAYYEYSGVTAVPLMREYPNIVVTRTLSKAFGLASLRIGYAIARPECIAEMLKVRGPYDVNMAAYHAACAALDGKAAAQEYAREVMERAKPLVERFFASSGIPYFESQADFVLFRPGDPAGVMERLADGGVLVRHLREPGVEDLLRVSIGTVEQMERFTAVYRERCL